MARAVEAAGAEAAARGVALKILRSIEILRFKRNQRTKRSTVCLFKTQISITSRQIKRLFMTMIMRLNGGSYKSCFQN